MILLEYYNMNTYINWVSLLPLKPSIIFETDAQREVWQMWRVKFEGASIWLKTKILGERLPSGDFWITAQHCLPFADYLEATFRLCVGVYLESKNSQIKGFSSPAAFWYRCCVILSQRHLEVSGLTGTPHIIGKRELRERQSQFLTHLQSHKLQFGITPTIEDYPEELLLIEAQELAKAKPGFDEDYLLPYVRAMRRVNKKIDRSKYLQYFHILPNGTLFTTGKDVRVPEP
jgi:hypothetical protein